MARRNIFEPRMKITQLHDICFVIGRVDAHCLEMLRGGDADRLGVKRGCDVADSDPRPSAFLAPVGLKAAELQGIAAGRHLAPNNALGPWSRDMLRSKGSFDSRPGTSANAP